jgi:hypothetical protein
MLPKINAYTDVPSNFGFRVRLVIYSVPSHNLSPWCMYSKHITFGLIYFLFFWGAKLG